MNDDIQKLERQLLQLKDRKEVSARRADLLLALADRYSMADPARALAHAEEALAMAQNLGYDRGIAHALGYKGFILYLQSEHGAARDLMQKSRNLMEEQGDTQGLAHVLGGLATVELSLGNYEQALTDGLRALKLNRELGLKDQEAWCLNGLGVGYFEIGDTERALAYHQQSLALFDEFGEVRGKARALTGIGTVLQSLGRLDEAQRHHEESLELYRKGGDVLGESRALNDLGTVAFARGEVEQALAYHRRSLELREALGSRQAQATSLMNLGRIYLHQGDFDRALEALSRALEYAVDINSLSKIYQVHQALSEVYEKQGDLAQALEHFQAFHRIREAVSGEEAMVRFNRLMSEFEMEKAEREAEMARQRNTELKAKNDQLESLLQELRATQAQLVQAEKMASLGRLTAGIAHEIKNPLNFVNNFAKLSLGLLNDLEDELAAPGGEPGNPAPGEILDDLRFNAEKIQEHGQRADSIVRSMMQHARGKKGEHHPTDLNALLDESVNLAYHGMRAQLPGFNTTLERDFDEAVGVLSVVPQEISRVFLNLLGNAFYAVLEKKEAGIDGYAPTVWVSTRRTDEGVEVRIRDNGPGIPKALQVKIFEPFFTTKPAGSGTGLGLSLSYEAVVQGHGGTMRVESREGDGATFVITLPNSPPSEGDGP